MRMVGSLVFMSMQFICNLCMHNMLICCIGSGVHDSMHIVTYAGVGAYCWTWGLYVHTGCTFRVCHLHVNYSLRARLPAVVLKTADSLTPAVVVIIVKQ